MTDLLKEAIADAKAVREVALANAKLALEEAFTPRLQSMLASKLSEEAEEDEEMTEGEEEEEHMEEGEEEEKMEEGEYGDEGDEISMEAYEEDSMEEGEESTEEPGDEIHEEEEEMEDEEPMDEELMEIIRQLEEELDSSEIGTGDNKQPSKSASDDHTEDKKEKLVQLVNEEEEEEEKKVEEAKDEDEVDIQEILRALREEEEEEKVEEGEEEEEMKEAKLREAYAVIQFLREKLNEVNLLNSKLLFSNKLFRAHSLTESQKITVIENFDRAKTLREVKLIYATLAESLKNTKVKQLKESFASKPQASTRPSKAILSESTQMADRLRKLAGLK